MEQSHLFYPLLSELNQAISTGYFHAFNLHLYGCLYCLKKWDKQYDINEFSIKTIPCTLLNTTLYLITTNNGLLGTMIKYHEY